MTLGYEIHMAGFKIVNIKIHLVELCWCYNFPRYSFSWLSIFVDTNFREFLDFERLLWQLKQLNLK